MRAKSFFGCFQHIQQNIGFIRRAVCEDPLCFDVGHLRHTGELPADKGFETHDLCSAFKVADVTGGLVDHSRQHCLRDVLVLSDFLDSLAKDNVIELHKDTS